MNLNQPQHPRTAAEFCDVMHTVFGDPADGAEAHLLDILTTTWTMILASWSTYPPTAADLDKIRRKLSLHTFRCGVLRNATGDAVLVSDDEAVNRTLADWLYLLLGIFAAYRAGQAIYQLPPSAKEPTP